MRILKLLVGAALLCVAVNCNAQGYQQSYVTPTFGGGYNVQTYGSRGSYQQTYITPTFGGGYNSQTYGSHGSYQQSYATPTFGGGYNIQTFRYGR